MSWQATVTNGLHAHFKQSDGPSRPAVEWSVVLNNGTDERTILVRSYADEGRSVEPNEEIPRVLAFIDRLLGTGWTPADYQNEPGELVVPSAE